MEVNQKLVTRQKVLVPTTKKMKKVDHSEENGRFPPHSVQPPPTPRDDNHVQSPAPNRRLSKAKKSAPVRNKKIFPCKTCLRPFTNATSAARHAYTHLSRDELEQSSLFHANCPHCEKVFFIRRDFIDHVNGHEGRKNHACPVCKEKFTRKAHLTQHLFVHLSRKERAEVAQGWRHVCYFCSKRFKAPSQLGRHVVVHTREKFGGMCPTCRKSFSTERALTQHRFSHLSDDEKITLVKQRVSRVCLFCRKIFANNDRYHTHLGTHTKEKPFSCDQCGKLFCRNYGLNMHARIHSADPRPFKCTECEQGFSQKISLARHKRAIHCKRKDIRYPKCAQKFGRKDHVVQNLRIVHLKMRHPIHAEIQS